MNAFKMEFTEYFNKDYFLLELQRAGVLKNFDKSDAVYSLTLEKVPNITIGLVLAVKSLKHFEDNVILNWIRKGRKLTELIKEQFALYDKLSIYLQKNVCTEDDIQNWKQKLHESKYVLPENEGIGWSLIFGYTPDLLEKVDPEKISNSDIVKQQKGITDAECEEMEQDNEPEIENVNNESSETLNSLSYVCFSHNYFLTILQEVGAFTRKDIERDIPTSLEKVSNINIGLVLAAKAVNFFTNETILTWIRKGRKLTPLIEKQFLLYEKLADYLTNNVEVNDVDEWKSLVNAKYVFPSSDNDGWALIFGERPELCHKIDEVNKSKKQLETPQSEIVEEKLSCKQMENLKSEIHEENKSCKQLESLKTEIEKENESCKFSETSNLELDEAQKICKTEIKEGQKSCELVETPKTKEIMEKVAGHSDKTNDLKDNPAVIMDETDGKYDDPLNKCKGDNMSDSVRDDDKIKTELFHPIERSSDVENQNNTKLSNQAEKKKSKLQEKSSLEICESTMGQESVQDKNESNTDLSKLSEKKSKELSGDTISEINDLDDNAENKINTKLFNQSEKSSSELYENTQSRSEGDATSNNGDDGLDDIFDAVGVILCTAENNDKKSAAKPQSEKERTNQNMEMAVEVVHREKITHSSEVKDPQSVDEMFDLDNVLDYDYNNLDSDNELQENEENESTKKSSPARLHGDQVNVEYSTHKELTTDLTQPGYTDLPATEIQTEKQVDIDSRKPVSRVVQIYDIEKQVTDEDIVQLALPFGKVANKLIKRYRRKHKNKDKNMTKAFLEMTDEISATRMVEKLQSSPPVQLLGEHVSVYYNSKLMKLPTEIQTEKQVDKSKKNRGHCYTYNKHGQCNEPNCKFAHSCNECDKTHPQKHCSIKRKRPRIEERERGNNISIMGTSRNRSQFKWVRGKSTSIQYQRHSVSPVPLMERQLKSPQLQHEPFSVPPPPNQYQRPSVPSPQALASPRIATSPMTSLSEVAARVARITLHKDASYVIEEVKRELENSGIPSTVDVIGKVVLEVTENHEKMKVANYGHGSSNCSINRQSMNSDIRQPNWSQRNESISHQSMGQIYQSSGSNQPGNEWFQHSISREVNNTVRMLPQNNAEQMYQSIDRNQPDGGMPLSSEVNNIVRMIQQNNTEQMYQNIDKNQPDGGMSLSSEVNNIVRKIKQNNMEQMYQSNDRIQPDASSSGGMSLSSEVNDIVRKIQQKNTEQMYQSIERNQPDASSSGEMSLSSEVNNLVRKLQQNNTGQMYQSNDRIQPDACSSGGMSLSSEVNNIVRKIQQNNTGQSGVRMSQQSMGQMYQNMDNDKPGNMWSQGSSNLEVQSRGMLSQQNSAGQSYQNSGHNGKLRNEWFQGLGNMSSSSGSMLISWSQRQSTQGPAPVMQFLSQGRSQGPHIRLKGINAPSTMGQMWPQGQRNDMPQSNTQGTRSSEGRGGNRGLPWQQSHRHEVLRQKRFNSYGYNAPPDR